MMKSSKRSRVPQGFGKPKTPKKPPNVQQTTYTNSYIDIVGVISCGPVEGIVGWTDGTYIDGTPVSSNGMANFAIHAMDFRNGELWQSAMNGFGDEIVSQRSVGTEIKGNLPPLTKAIVNNSLDAIGISLSFTLQEYTDNGGVLGSAIHFQIFIKQGEGGAFVLRHDQVVSGRYASPVIFDYRFPVTRGLGKYYVRIDRITPDNANTSKYQQTLQWYSYTEYTSVRMRYPLSAYAALRLDASQFDSTPEISFLFAGRRCLIPNNATVAGDRGLNYNGAVWSGGLYEPVSACSDPAWILYDLITNNVHGMGDVVKVNNVDIWSFYELSQWCNQYVPDGRGGWERRYRCNVVLSDKDEAWKVLDAISSICRIFLYYIRGTIYIAIDKPQAPTMQFTTADVIDGLFNYARPPYSDRYSVAMVTWNDPADNYQRAIEMVEDTDLIEKLGVRVIELSAYGCTSQGQAIRAGKYALHKPGSVTFTARHYGALARPGQVIKIFDNRSQQIENSGLVKGSTMVAAITGSSPTPARTVINLDRPVTIEPGTTYRFSVTHIDGKLEERTVITGPGAYTSVTTEAFTKSLRTGANWILSSGDITPALYTVINVTSSADDNFTTAEIFAIEHDPQLWNRIENDVVTVPRAPRKSAPTVVPVPSSVGLSSFTTKQINASPKVTMLISWLAPTNDDGSRNPYITSYFVEYRRGIGGDWGDTKTVNTPNLEIDGIQGGFYYQARISAVSIDGKSSQWVETNYRYFAPTVDLNLRNSQSTLTLAIL